MYKYKFLSSSQDPYNPYYESINVIKSIELSGKEKKPLCYKIQYEQRNSWFKCIITFNQNTIVDIGLNEIFWILRPL
jgi:hypothetical protein